MFSFFFSNFSFVENLFRWQSQWQEKQTFFMLQPLKGGGREGHRYTENIKKYFDKTKKLRNLLKKIYR
jgi:hypothetical protein